MTAFEFLDRNFDFFAVLIVIWTLLFAFRTFRAGGDQMPTIVTTRRGRCSVCGAKVEDRRARLMDARRGCQASRMRFEAWDSRANEFAATL